MSLGSDRAAAQKGLLLQQPHRCCTELEWPQPASVTNLELFAKNWDGKVSNAPRALQQNEVGVLPLLPDEWKMDFFS